MPLLRVDHKHMCSIVLSHLSNAYKIHHSSCWRERTDKSRNRKEEERKIQFESWYFEPSQPQRITSGLKKTSIYLLFTMHTSHQTTNSPKTRRMEERNKKNNLITYAHTKIQKNPPPPHFFLQISCEQINICKSKKKKKS